MVASAAGRPKATGALAPGALLVAAAFGVAGALFAAPPAAGFGCAAAHHSHSATAAKILQILVFPSNNVNDAWDLLRRCNIDALHHRICIGAS